MSENAKTYTTSQLKEKLRKAFSSFELKKKYNLVLSVTLLFLVWLLLFLFLENTFYFSPAFKIFYLAGSLAITFAVYRLGHNNVRYENFQEFYQLFSHEHGFKELSYVLDLEQNHLANASLVEAAIQKNIKQIDYTRLDHELQRFAKRSDVSKRFGILYKLVVLLVIITFFTGFTYHEPLTRIAHFWERYEKPNPFHYTIYPGNITTEQGKTFSASVIFEGESPKEVHLNIKTDIEQAFRQRALEQTDTGYISVPFTLNNNLEYFVEMDRFKSEIYHIDIQLRPRFTELTATIIPPLYTRLDSVIVQYPFSQLRAYPGSKLLLHGYSNKPLRKLELVQQSQTKSIPVKSGYEFSRTQTVTKNDTLKLQLIDETGLTNENPFEFTITALIDEYPYVELIEPAQSLEMVNPAELPILFRASDDFGLSAANLHYQLYKAFVDKPVNGKIPLNRPVNGGLETFLWNLKDIQLGPQDELTFWIEAGDNDRYHGFKFSRSNSITLKIPSLVDYFDDLNEREDDVKSDLKNVSDSFREMDEQYKQFREKLQENPDNINYEHKLQLERVQNLQEDVQKKIEDLNTKFEEIKKEINENKLLSEETIQAYDELEKLIKEIDDPALQDALEKMREQMSQMNPDQLRKAMENIEFNEALYKERIERTIELFKQLKTLSNLEKLAKTFEEKAKEEEQKSTEGSDDKEITRQNENLLRETEELKKQIENLSKDITPKTGQSISDYQKKSKQELDNIGEQLKEQQNKQGKPNKTFQQEFEQLAKMTRSTMKGMSQKQLQVNINGLKYILYSLLTLSNEQEDLATYASITENRSQAFVNYARNQKNIEDIFGSLSDSLFQLSTEIPQFSNDINKRKLEVEQQITRSLEQMAEREQNASSIATRQALGGINEISFMIANLLEQLSNQQNSSGGGGMGMQQMMEQLQQSGQSQQQLNQQIEDMINDIQGEKLTRDQMGRLEQLAKQQNDIRKQLEELQQNAGIEGGNKLASDLQRMIEDMEETINDLRGGAADPLLVKRQQNILSRMLEAEKAIQEKDEEEKREGKTAVDRERATPPELTLEELEKQIKNKLNDPNFTKFSPDYQKLIEKYFELLKQLQSKEIQ